ncbi:MAG: hypothetical protein ACLR0P_05550 [Oscillospiraceae bacterium]
MNKTKRVIALGFFDGVHTGHGALLQRVTQRARSWTPSPPLSPSTAVPLRPSPASTSRSSALWRTGSG